MSFTQPPTATGAHPFVRNPPIAGTTRVPMATDPYVPAAHPVPVTAEPNIAGLRRSAIHLDLRCGRSHTDGTADVHFGCGNRNGAADDAARQHSR